MRNATKYCDKLDLRLAYGLNVFVLLDTHDFIEELEIQRKSEIRLRVVKRS